MISIVRANDADNELIVRIGRSGVEESHRDSCSVEDMNEFLDTHYNYEAIKKELNASENIYHIIYYLGKPAGFTKIIFNTEHENIEQKNVTKLDRIYLLKEFYDLKIGFELLKFNIKFSKANGQSGMWLFTWQGNERAVAFYKKVGFTIVGRHKFKVTETHYNPHFHMLLKY